MRAPWDSARDCFCNNFRHTNRSSTPTHFRPCHTSHKGSCRLPKCDDLAREFDEEFRTLNDQHESCLAKAPNDEVPLGETCTKSSCQSLHTAKDEVGKNATRRWGFAGPAWASIWPTNAGRKRKTNAGRRKPSKTARIGIAGTRSGNGTGGTPTGNSRKTVTAEPTKRKPTTTGRRSRAEKSRHGRDQDRQRATADQQRRQAEALRQANFLAITQAADRLKDTWKERLRGGLPDVASELSSFMQVVRGVARGDGSYSVSDLLVATNTLADRAQTTFALITSPFQTFSDQVTADAIDMVRADRTYQRDDPRVQPIFRGIQKVNEIVHERNHPFSEAISSAAFEQIDTHFKTIIGELEHLEADIGSFDYSRRKYADQPLANPFRQAPLHRLRHLSNPREPLALQIGGVQSGRRLPPRADDHRCRGSHRQSLSIRLRYCGSASNFFNSRRNIR